MKNHVEPPYVPPTNAPVVGANRPKSVPVESQANPQAAAELEAVTNPAQEADAFWPSVRPDSLPFVTKPKSKWTKKDHKDHEVWLICVEHLLSSSTDHETCRWRAKEARRLNPGEQVWLDNWLAQREENLRNLKEHADAVQDEDKNRIRLAQLREEKLLKEKSSWEFIFKSYLPKEFEPVISRQTLKCIAAASQITARIKLAKVKCQDDLEKWDKLFAEKAKWSWGGYRQQRAAIIAENEADLREGFEGLAALPSPEKFETDASIKRALIKAQQSEIAARVNPIILELAQLLQDGARDMARELLVSERRTCDDWGIKFEASPILTMTVYVGYALKDFVRLNWQVNALTNPREVLYGILDPKTDWQ